MPPPVFIDTNILLYAASNGRQDPLKTRLARELLRSRPWVISLQVVQEFHVNATRKVALGIDVVQAANVLDGLLERAVVGLDAELFTAAVLRQNRFSLSYWDAAILSAANRAGCVLVYSEDMASGQVYDDVLVLNPFAENGRWLLEDHPWMVREK